MGKKTNKNNEGKLWCFGSYSGRWTLKVFFPQPEREQVRCCFIAVSRAKTFRMPLCARDPGRIFKRWRGKLLPFDFRATRLSFNFPNFSSAVNGKILNAFCFSSTRMPKQSGGISKMYTFTPFNRCFGRKRRREREKGFSAKWLWQFCLCTLVLWLHFAKLKQFEQLATKLCFVLFAGKRDEQSNYSLPFTIAQRRNKKKNRKAKHISGAAASCLIKRKTKNISWTEKCERWGSHGPGWYRHIAERDLRWLR